jgi:hypothetical protein
MARTSFVACVRWESSRFSPRRGLHGRIPYCERVIGTLRRDCLDHVIVVSEQHLRRILRKYLEYYHGSRTHLALGKDAPELRERESPDGGTVIALPMVGGLHHRYTRRAA